MTNKTFATQGSPYFRTEDSVKRSYNAATRTVSAYDLLKKDHAGVSACDRKEQFNRLYSATVELCQESSRLRERVAIAAAFEGIVLEGARWIPMRSATTSISA